MSVLFLMIFPSLPIIYIKKRLESEYMYSLSSLFFMYIIGRDGKIIRNSTDTNFRPKIVQKRIFCDILQVSPNSVLALYYTALC